MPNIKSAEKRVKVIARRTLENKMIKTKIKTLVKKLEALIANGEKVEATALLKDVIKNLDQAAAKGVYHKNTISRKKSRLTNALNKMS